MALVPVILTRDALRDARIDGYGDLLAQHSLLARRIDRHRKEFLGPAMDLVVGVWKGEIPVPDEFQAR